MDSNKSSDYDYAESPYRMEDECSYDATTLTASEDGEDHGEHNLLVTPKIKIPGFGLYMKVAVWLNSQKDNVHPNEDNIGTADKTDESDMESDIQPNPSRQVHNDSSSTSSLVSSSPDENKRKALAKIFGRKSGGSQ